MSGVDALLSVPLALFFATAAIVLMGPVWDRVAARLRRKRIGDGAVLDHLYGRPDAPQGPPDPRSGGDARYFPRYMRVGKYPTRMPSIQAAEADRIAWAETNDNRQRMGLPVLTFAQWCAGAPLDAATIYPESAASLKRLPHTAPRPGRHYTIGPDGEPVRVWTIGEQP
jgi:hypothetical protein